MDIQKLFFCQNRFMEALIQIVPSIIRNHQISQCEIHPKTWTKLHQWPLFMRILMTSVTGKFKRPTSGWPNQTGSRKQYIFRKTLTHLNITWRYSPNSEIFTIILHSVSNDFPAGAKIKFRNGRKFIDSAHLEKDRFKDIEEKLNLKVSC